jgi:PAS domain S-box-containing protein
MDAQPGDVAEEVKRLQRCNNDLVSLLALPAMWSGAEPSQIVHTLLEALQRMLQLDLVYVRLQDQGGRAPIEMVRFGGSQKPKAQPHEIGEVLNRRLEAGSLKWPPRIPNPIGEGDLSILPLGLGLQGDIGVIVAGSERADFPRQTERLILSVAANQASMGVQGARLLGEQKQVASELDRAVAQQTAEIAAANEELRKQIADRKHAEEDLRSSEEKYRLVVETANDAVISMDDNGTIQFANRAAERMFGYDPTELVGRPLTALMPESVRKLHDAGFRRYLATGQRNINWRGTELTALRKDGQELPVEVSFGELTRNGRKVFTGFLRDVSERRQAREAQQALHAIQTRQVAARADVSLAFGRQDSLDAILHECAESIVRHLDAAFARIWTISQDGTTLELQASAGLYTHLNGAHSRIPIGELKIGRIALEQKHVLTNDIISDSRISDKTWAANEGMSSFAGYPLLLGTRTLGVVAMFSRTTLSAGTAEALASIADLIAHGIERKRAENKLRASERDLSSIIETIPGLVWCAAPEGELNYLNRRILDYTGTSSDAWAQLGWKNLLHPDDREATVQAWAHAVATGEAHQTQCRFRRSDGVYRWFQVLGQAARDSAGKIFRWYGLLIDIDDRKNTEEALRGSQARLSRAIQTATVGEFAAAIAHEMNQPLAAVVANGQACLRWLAAQPPVMTKAQEAAERIVRDGKDAGEVVRRIRALFKLAAIEKVELDLNEVIGEVLHLLSGETAKRRVAVEADLGEDLTPVVGDRVQLQQVVFNLLLNAIEAIDMVADRPRKLFVCSKHSSPGTVLVEVRDNGPGIKDPDKIFDAFFTTKESGMGMGLAICRSIIDAHRGRLWAASEEAVGATFSFTLPVRAAS